MASDSATATIGLLPAMTNIALGGCLGGIAYGLLNKGRHSVWLLKWEFRLGLVWNAIFGAIAGFAVYVATPILNLDWTRFGEPGEFARIFAVAILAGFAGVTLLPRLSKKLADQVSHDIDEQIEKKIQEKDEVAVLSLVGKSLIQAKNFAGALEVYEDILKLVPNNPSYLLTKGHILKNLNRLGEAEKVADAIVRMAPDHPLAFYNRACYRTLIDPVGNKNAILADLDQAFSMIRGLRHYVVLDADLAVVRQWAEYTELTNRYK